MGRTFKRTEKEELKLDTFDKLFDKIEKQCAFSLKNMAEIVNTCDSINETVTETKQTTKKLSAQIEEL